MKYFLILKGVDTVKNEMSKIHNYFPFKENVKQMQTDYETLFKLKSYNTNRL